MYYHSNPFRSILPSQTETKYFQALAKRLFLLASFLFLCSGLLNAQWSSTQPVPLTSGGRPSIIDDGADGKILAVFTGTTINVVKFNSDGVGQWSSSFGHAFGQQVPVRIASDGAGGVIIAYIAIGNGNDIRAQRINGAGVIQWGASGVAVCNAPLTQQDPTIVSDGLGGAFISWYDYNIGGLYAQRLNAAGIAQWATNGIVIRPSVLSTYNAFGPPMISNVVGEVTIAWAENRYGYSDIFVQRLNSQGLAQWTDGGIQITNSSGSDMLLTGDGSGGSIIVWKSSSTVRGQRLDSNGVPQWQAGGNIVSTGSGIPNIISDDAGGALITIYASAVRAQHINGQGITQWAQEAVICPSGYSPVFPSVTSDGAGGCMVAWFDFRNNNNYQVFAQRVNASGIIQWTPDGVSIHPSLATQGYPAITSNGTGGAIVSWSGYPTFPQVFAQNIKSDGSLGPSPVIPAVNSFSPDNGYTGMTVTINGTGFSTANTVRIGGINATSFSVINDNTITAVIDTGASGPVSVATPAGSASSVSGFTYNGFRTIRSGNWSDGMTWLGGRVPTTGVTVTIDTNRVTVDVPVINSGIINCSDTIVIASTFMNGGTMNVTGYLKIHTGGVFNGNSPIYAHNSALVYETGTFSPGFEWTGNSNIAGYGVPHRVEVIFATVNMPAANRGTGGPLILDHSTMNLNHTSGDLYLGGSFWGNNGGIFHSNGRTLIFNGNLSQGKFVLSEPLYLDKLVIDKTGGETLSCNNDLIVQSLVLNGILAIFTPHSIHVLGDLTWISGYIDGTLVRNIQTGTRTYDFPVGSVSGQTLASFTLFNVSSGGNFLVTTDDDKSVNYPNNLSNTNYLSRHWTVNTDIVFSTANARFKFLPSDITGNVLPGQFRAYKYNGSFSFPPHNDYSINDTTYLFNNITSFSEFGAGVDESALPVTLLSFTGSQTADKQVKLVWRTASELNFSHFTLERSKNGIDFIPIGNVAAKGSSSEYLFKNALTPGINFYRLKIVDIDGKFTYSHTIKVSNTLAPDQLLTFPNPAQNNLVITHTKAGGNATIVITGVNGSRVLMQNILRDAVQTEVDISRMQKGSYVATFYNEGKKHSIPFTKQ